MKTSGFNRYNIIDSSKKLEKSVREELSGTIGVTKNIGELTEKLFSSEYFWELPKEKRFDLFINLTTRLAIRIGNNYINDPYKDQHLLEEYISEAFYGLIKAANTYKPEKKVKFSNYSGRCMHNEIRMFLKKEKSRIQPLSLDEDINSNVKNYDEFTLFDTIEGRNNIEEFLDNDEKDGFLGDIYGFLKKLNKLEVKVLAHRYGLLDDKQKTQKETAAKLGIDRSYVSRLETRALNKLREFYIKKYNIRPVTGKSKMTKANKDKNNGKK